MKTEGTKYDDLIQHMLVILLSLKGRPKIRWTVDYNEHFNTAADMNHTGCDAIITIKEGDTR